MPDGAHTHGSGGAELVVVAGGVVALVAVLAPVLIALIHALLVAVIVLAAITVPAAGGLIVWYCRRSEPPNAVWVRAGVHPRDLGSEIARRSQPPLPPARSEPRAIEQHVHFHGVTAEDVAEIIRRQGGGG